MIARQERWEKSSQRIQIEIHQRAGCDDPPHTGNAQNRPRRRVRRTACLAGSACRFIEAQQRRDEQHGRQRGGDQRHAPSPGLRRGSTEDMAERGANRNPQHKNGQRPRAPFGGKQVADPTGGRRCAGGFAQIHAHARTEQHRVAFHQSAESRKRGPHGHAWPPAIACGFRNRLTGRAATRSTHTARSARCPAPPTACRKGGTPCGWARAALPKLAGRRNSGC